MSEPEPVNTHPPQLLAIKVIFCENGAKKEQWVNLDDVQAISWGENPMDPKQGGNGGKVDKLPKGSGPGGCHGPAIPSSGGGAPMCWWTGTKWECGETQE